MVYTYTFSLVNRTSMFNLVFGRIRMTSGRRLLRYESDVYGQRDLILFCLLSAVGVDVVYWVNTLFRTNDSRR